MGSKFLGELFNKNYKWCCLLLSTSLFIATSCAIVSTSTTSPAVVKQVGYAKAAADIVSTSYTDKSTSDHAVSFALNKDCKISRVIKRVPICLEYGPKVIDVKRDTERPNLTNQLMHVAMYKSEQKIDLTNSSFKETSDKEFIPLKRSVNYDLPHSLSSKSNENILEVNKPLNSELLPHTLEATSSNRLEIESTLVNLDNNLCSSI